MKRSLVVLGFVVGVAGVSQAQVLNPSNGHYYEFVSDSLDWSGANAGANGLSYLGLNGHLATVTDSSEASFLATSFGQAGWLGGYQQGDTTASDGWHWVTGEAWSYTNWNSGEPNDFYGPQSEQNLMMYSNGLWNDEHPTGMGYYVEFEAVPEPFTMAFVGVGALALVRRKKK